MTRKEMDKLKVGDKVEVRTYNTTEEEYEWIPTEVSQVFVCSDGGRFAHGGFHSVCAKVKGVTETLTPELTRLPLSPFARAYLEAERELREECDEMVRNGELSEEDAEFRFQMVRDEILESMIAADLD